MPISTLRAWEAAQEADEQLAAEQERREELERGYRELEAHATMLETQVSELRELNERQERHDMIFTAIVVGICLLLLIFASGCIPAEAEESEAASVPPVIVDASDQKAQERRSHEVEAVEAGKLDSDGNPIDGEKFIVTKLREYVQKKRDEMAAIAAEAQQDDVSDGVCAEDEYPYQNENNWGSRDISQVKMATTTGELLGGDGVHRDESGNTYTWYPNDIGNGSIEGRIPGCHYDENGVAYDGDGYIAVARSDYDPEVETIIDTPYGPAKLYDTCPMYGNVDIYTNR